jgi:hypothetical protein
MTIVWTPRKRGPRPEFEPMSQFSGHGDGRYGQGWEPLKIV